jgi:hypothetical protein
MVKVQEYCYSVILLEKECTGRYVTPLKVAIFKAMLSREEVNTKFIVFGVTSLAIEPMIYLIQGEHLNHCIPDTASIFQLNMLQKTSKTRYETRQIKLYLF